MNQKYGITLPLNELREYPDLTPATIGEWDTLCRLFPVFPPADVEIGEDLGHISPVNTFTLQLSKGVPTGLLQELVKQATEKANGGKLKTRCRADKREKQRHASGLLTNGFTIAEISVGAGASQSTVKSRVVAQSKMTKHKPVSGKAWKANHVKNCPICKKVGILSFKDCPVARGYMSRTPSSKKTNPHAVPCPAELVYLLPRKPVHSEKSIFAKWHSRHSPPD